MSGSEPIYLDYAATTPVDRQSPRRWPVSHAPEELGNAASVTHVFGRRAAAHRGRARAGGGAHRRGPAEIFFTSGATESNNLALLGIARANADRGRHIMTSRIEHKAVLDRASGWRRKASR